MNLATRKALFEHLTTCAGEVKSMRHRVREQSVPLWMAVFFANNGIPPSRMQGNRGLSHKRLARIKAAAPERAELICRLLGAGGKSEADSHADFVIMAPPKESDEALLDYETTFEVKSCLSYPEKNSLDIGKVFQDLCVTAAYQVALQKPGQAYMVYIHMAPLGCGYELSSPEDLIANLRKRIRKKLGNDSQVVEKVLDAQMIWVID